VEDVTKESKPEKFDVIIIGAGPVGLMTANMLGSLGIKVLMLEKLDKLIDYPRGVGIDDESIRTIQAIDLEQKAMRHITPFHWARFYNSKRKLLASIEPRQTTFGWSRRNAFHQPLVDKILHEGLSRYENVTLKFSSRVETYLQDNEGVMVTGSTRDGELFSYQAKYLVGSDGGASEVRSNMNVTFDGSTAPDPFLVVDIEDDPIGTPNLEFICDPRFPYVSIALPHGVRRLEFKVEKDQIVNDIDVTDEFMTTCLNKIKPSLNHSNILRRRVYRHNARLVSDFREKRFILAGDAAHLMPVWQGQGYNSGLRDANNLAWKLAMVVKGVSSDKLLDSYSEERRQNSKEMIDISVLTGKLFSPSNRFLAVLRDVVFGLSKLIPAAHKYITTMKWKPIPKFTKGILVTAPKKEKHSPVGTIFFQPDVKDEQGNIKKLDNIIGLNFAIIAWGSDPSIHFDDETRDIVKKIGAKILTVVPEEQRESALEIKSKSDSDSEYIFDHTYAVNEWFDWTYGSVVVIRPDRFVAGITQPSEFPELMKALAKKLALVKV